MDELEKSLPHDLSSLLESGKGTEVSLVCADGPVVAHRLVLEARSRVFATVLQPGQEFVLIPDMPKNVVRQMLTFIYMDTVPRLPRFAPDLLVLADRFELPVLKHMCEQHLMENLCVENTVPYCVLALRHKCVQLRSAAISYFANHALQVLGSKGWVQELRADPKLLVEISRMVAAQATVEASVEELQTLLATGVRLNEDDVVV